MGIPRSVDELIDANRICLAFWDAFQQAGLHATFHIQNTVIQASRTMLDATLLVPARPKARRPGSGRLWPEATLKLTARGTRWIPPAPSDTADEVVPAPDQQWADSALHFQPPFGLISLDQPDPDEEA